MCSTDLRRSSEGANKIWLTTETGRLKDHNLEMQAPKNKAVKMGFYSVIVLTLKRVWLKKESYLACQLVIFLHKSKFGEMEVFGFFWGNQMESKGSVCGRLFAGGFLWWKFFENFPPSSNQMKSDGGVCERKTHESFLWEGGSLSWKFFESFLQSDEIRRRCLWEGGSLSSPFPQALPRTEFFLLLLLLLQLNGGNF